MPQSFKQIIILLGAPGSGKGTQAGLLCEKFNLHYFETSRVLEEGFKSSDADKEIEIEGKMYSATRERKENWETGNLCSPPFVTILVKNKIKELCQEGKNILFAGSPRTQYEVERVMPLLEELYGKENIKTIVVDISAEATVFRNTHRRICELMRHSILYSKETEALEHCPIDGSKLLKRAKLDDPESIKVRIQEYENRTLPVVDYLEENGFDVKRVNGEKSVAEVYGGILETLK
jgi:adenylate kinase